MNRLLLFSIGLVVIVSGCIVGGDTASDDSVTCSSMHLRVGAADGASASVTNLGDDAFGNVTATWEYYNNDAVVREFSAPEGGQTEIYESGRDQRMRSFEVQHNDCPSRRASY